MQCVQVLFLLGEKNCTVQCLLHLIQVCLHTANYHTAQKLDFLDHNNVIVVIYGLYSIFCNFTNLVKDEQQTFTQSEFQLAYLTKLLSTF